MCFNFVRCLNSRHLPTVMFIISLMNTCMLIIEPKEKHKLKRKEKNSCKFVNKFCYIVCFVFIESHTSLKTVERWIEAKECTFFL